MVNFKGMRFPIDVILVCIRWYAAPAALPSLGRDDARARRVGRPLIDQPVAIRFLPLIEKMARKYKRPLGGRWRMGETYIEVKGVRKDLYRAVNKQGKTFDFLLTAKRDIAAARRFFDKAMGANGAPEKVAMDKRGANKAAIDAINAGRFLPILVRKVKYLNNIIEQDHRAIKRVTRPMLNFESFRAAGSVLAGIDLVHMTRKRQFAINGADPMSFADQIFYPDRNGPSSLSGCSYRELRRLINNATARPSAHQGHLASDPFSRDVDLTAPAAR